MEFEDDTLKSKIAPMRVTKNGFELIFGNRSKSSLFQKLACGDEVFVPHTQFIDDFAQTGWSRISRATNCS